MRKNLLFFAGACLSLFCNAQNVGIGTTTPGARLHVMNGSSGYPFTYFPGAVVEGNTNSYINILTPNDNESGLLFGKGFSAAHGGIVYNNTSTLSGLQFRTNSNVTRMVINSVGHVGIGATNPSYLLDVSGRMRIRSGGNNFVSAGLWLNNNSNTEAAFFGMEDDTHVGLFGTGAGWGFSMNTENGALKVNGSQGAPGQVLASNGNSDAPSWKTLGATIQTYYKYPNNLMQSEGALTTGSSIIFSALSHSITVNTKSRLIISAIVMGGPGSCVNCGYSDAAIDILVNGNEAAPGTFIGVTPLVAPNGVRGTATISNFFYDVNPGTHTIEFLAQGLTGPNMYVYSKYSTIIVLPID